MELKAKVEGQMAEIKTPGVVMVTSRLMGCFLDDHRSRKEVLSLMGY